MPTPKHYSFTFKEVASLLAKDAGVTEGHWGIFLKFGIQGANIGPTDDDLRPAAIIPILEIGLHQFESPNNLSVDAAELGSGQKQG